MVNFFVELLVNFYDAFIGVAFVLVACKTKFKDCWISSSISVFVCFMISTVFLILENDSIVQSLLILGVLLAFSLMLPSKKRLPKILSPILFELLLTCSNIICILFLGLILNVSVSDVIGGMPFARYLLMLSSKILLTVALLLVAKLFSYQAPFHLMDFVLYVFAPINTIVVLYGFIKLEITHTFEDDMPLIVAAAVGLVLTNVFSLALYVHASKNAEAKRELNLLEKQREFQHSKYEEQKRMFEQIAAQRHDFKEQLLGLEKLAAEHRYDEIKTFISESASKIDLSHNFIHTNNEMIDYILCSKKTVNPDIEFHVSGTLQNTGNLSDLNIAALFGNMLDNAIESNRRTGVKEITLKFFVHGAYQGFICKNPISESVLKDNPELKTTKKEKGIHGFGVRNMRKIVDDANGLIDFYEESGCFCVCIALPLSETDIKSI